MKKVVHLVHTITFIICLLIINGCRSSKASCSDNKNNKSAKIMYAQHKKATASTIENHTLRKLVYSKKNARNKLNLQTIIIIT